MLVMQSLQSSLWSTCGNCQRVSDNFGKGLKTDPANSANPAKGIIHPLHDPLTIDENERCLACGGAGEIVRSGRNLSRRSRCSACCGTGRIGNGRLCHPHPPFRHPENAALRLGAGRVVRAIQYGAGMNAPLTDLLGQPIMRRSAHFPAIGLRESLSRDWGPGPRAFVLGCNPSTADALRDDPTTLWLTAWFTLFGFGGYDLGNLYPFCTSDPAECRRISEAGWSGEWHDRDAMQHNLDTVARMAKAADQVFVCFGAIAWDDMWIHEVVEAIQCGDEPWPDLWSWGTTASGAPKHPMARGKHRIPHDQKPILWRAA